MKNGGPDLTERSLHIPTLWDKIVWVNVHEALQDIYRPVSVGRSFACPYGNGPIRAAFNVQHDMRVAHMKWGEDGAVIIAPDKETARKSLAKIKQFVKERLHLGLNSKTKIF